MKVKDFEKMVDKQESVEWFNKLLTERIKNLGMWQDDIEDIYEQAIVDNNKILKDFKKGL